MTDFPTYRRVLIATDGTEASAQAARHALALAQRFGAEVEALFAVEVDYHTGIHLREEVAELEQAGQRALDQVEALGAEVGLPVTRLLVRGDPGPTIVRLAGERGADLIVLGAHRMGRLERVLLGSVSHYVANNADIPVLLVRQG